jgi:hypothetical protein
LVGTRIMKAIFLDIDGVLIHRSFDSNDPDEFCPSACAHLRDILSRVPDARIVIISELRLGRTSDQVCRLVSGRTGILMEKFAGATPVGGKSRAHEIQSWLADHPRVTSFVILDDGDYSPLLSPCLIQTTQERGLLKCHADEAVRRLSVLV